MTKEEILNLKSGSELDALVVDNLFELKPGSDYEHIKSAGNPGASKGCSLVSLDGYWELNNGEWIPYESISECIWVAWDFVIEKMTELNYTWSLSRNKDDDITCCFGKHCVTTSSASESICKAALLTQLEWKLTLF